MDWGGGYLDKILVYGNEQFQAPVHASRCVEVKASP